MPTNPSRERSGDVVILAPEIAIHVAVVTRLERREVAEIGRVLYGKRQVGVRRCEQDDVFARALGLGGHCTECEQPILLADLLELEVMP